MNISMNSKPFRVAETMVFKPEGHKVVSLIGMLIGESPLSVKTICIKSTTAMASRNAIDFNVT